MDIDPELFRQAQRAFNSIRLMRGQIAHVATCDSEGRPDVAPIGSMRVVDADTIHVLQGMLPRTMKNLAGNPLAAFSVTTPVTFRKIASLLRPGSDEPLGYRIYGRLVAVNDDRAAVQREAQQLLSRVPRLLRAAFSRFFDRNLKRLLTFTILEIRPT